MPFPMTVNVGLLYNTIFSSQEMRTRWPLLNKTLFLKYSLTAGEKGLYSSGHFVKLKILRGQKTKPNFN